jgi:hypothetical protein
MKSRQGLITHLIPGIVGAFVGGFVLTPIPGVQSVETGLSLGYICERFGRRNDHRIRRPDAAPRITHSWRST